MYQITIREQLGGEVTVWLHDRLSPIGKGPTRNDALADATTSLLKAVEEIKLLSEAPDPKDAAKCPAWMVPTGADEHVARDRGARVLIDDENQKSRPL